MDNLWLILFWSGPIGLGIFLALFGVFVWLLAKADEIRKRTRAMEEELKKKTSTSQGKASYEEY